MTYEKIIIDAHIKSEEMARKAAEKVLNRMRLVPRGYETKLIKSSSSDEQIEGEP